MTADVQHYACPYINVVKFHSKKQFVVKFGMLTLIILNINI